MFPFNFWIFSVIGRSFVRIWLWRTSGIGDMLVCALFVGLYARFLLDRFCAGYDSASQAGGGTEEPIYSQALLLEPRHGLPPPPPQIASRFAAQINLEGQKKIQATALRAVLASPSGPATGWWPQRFANRASSRLGKMLKTEPVRTRERLGSVRFRRAVDLDEKVSASPCESVPIR